MLPKRPATEFAFGDSSQKRQRVSDASDNDQQAVPSEEVAGDFRDYLQDLSGNDRYQISSLTLIAKENTEHAMAISEVLLSHIRSVVPQRKLPALYVLDSIVKNVGTPYTIYLSRNLFKTFMDAYTLVDGQTRKQMESMLKTWKEPVPGSADKTPVFLVDTTRNIENALIRARTSFIEQQKQQAHAQPAHALPTRPGMPSDQSWRNTPTPPQYHQPFPPPSQLHGQPFGAQNFDLQYSSTLSPNLSNQQPMYHPPQHQSQPLRSPPPNFQSQYQPPPNSAQQASSTTQYPNTYSLVALLQAAGTFSPPSQPQPPPAPYPPIQPAAQQQQTYQYPGLGALYQSVSSAGYTTPPVNQPAVVAPPLPRPSTNTPQPPHTATPPNQALATDIKNDVKLNLASLKIPRPHLLATLYAHQPSQCTTCGRRFVPTPEGKARKGRHLDSHFRTNMKFADAARRGVSRSWYVGELDWIQSREEDDADEARANTAAIVDGAEDDFEESGLGGERGPLRQGKKSKNEKYIKAPSDAAMAKYACPICQEEFNAVWHDGAQEWVWMDAVKVGEKVYHSSCLEELAKDRGAAGTPAGGTGSSLTSSKAKSQFAVPKKDE